MRFAPPKVGEHTEEVLHDVLGLEVQDIQRLRDSGAI
jgi:crotonobetainyl-CoA:carnitine CoA-transferase CaiB-like acyl-CoA transferase